MWREIKNKSTGLLFKTMGKTFEIEFQGIVKQRSGLVHSHRDPAKKPSERTLQLASWTNYIITTKVKQSLRGMTRQHKKKKEGNWQVNAKS